MGVNPHLQTNRIADLGSTVRPSRRIALVCILCVVGVLAAFAAAAMGEGRAFDLFAMLAVSAGRWRPEAATWWRFAAIMAAAGAAALAASLAWRRRPGRAAGRGETRVDVYAAAMGYGEATRKLSREHAQDMARRLVADWDAATMEPGYPLGVNLKDRRPISTSWEDMVVVFAGPRSGKSLCYAIPAVNSAPGPCLATSNKGDIIDNTRAVREHRFPDGRIWVFDPERIADPGRGRANFVWDLVGAIRTLADAKRVADCWRYASGQPQTGGDDFFPGTAAQQLADYLFAAHLGGRPISDVFRWASNERDDEAAQILRRHGGYDNIAARVASVIALTPETRSGVFGSLQTMVAFLADPDLLDWVEPREGDPRPVFDAREFALGHDTLYLLSAQGRPSTALTAAFTAMTAFTAFNIAQGECASNNRRLPVPLCLVLDEAANICRWPELADVYSYFGSAGIPIMTIWQNPDQGKAAFGETNFGSLFNNANTLVYIGGIKDAKWLADISGLVGQRDIVRGSVNVDSRGSRSVNRSIQRENILDVSDLAEWPVGRALVLASQCRAQIARTVPWTEHRQWADLVNAARHTKEAA
ncbi:type IV secretory system conjugative DNA transfer family protein [Bifidobacterium choerinum]|uniref:Type IV secretion system protein VirD4 n=3 Tax=Bifidobacterium TaxID=1678 RepID=A0A2D3D653_9BIFI|nr:type IV secretory system conjugative DNA transfer family protein [Bifidobacterium choerinum]ATU20607.1 type IV secretion system protein VirD4 [Bifidobacterium choerinum]